MARWLVNINRDQQLEMATMPISGYEGMSPSSLGKRTGQSKSNSNVDIIIPIPTKSEGICSHQLHQFNQWYSEYQPSTRLPSRVATQAPTGSTPTAAQLAGAGGSKGAVGPMGNIEIQRFMVIFYVRLLSTVPTHTKKKVLTIISKHHPSTNPQFMIKWASPIRSSRAPFLGARIFYTSPKPFCAKSQDSRSVASTSKNQVF